jgi:hypothetical protein
MLICCLLSSRDIIFMAVFRNAFLYTSHSVFRKMSQNSSTIKSSEVKLSLSFLMYVKDKLIYMNISTFDLET